MSGVFRVVDFVVLFIGRIVSLLRGTVLSNNITIDNKDGGATIDVKIASDKKRNVKVEDWLKVATQVSEVSHAMGKHGSACDKGPLPLMYAPAPPPLMSAKCDRCRRLVDHIMGWALQRNCPPLGIVCPACFGSLPKTAMNGGAQPWSGSPEKDDGWATSPSEACVLCEVTERPRGTPSSGVSTSISLDAREHTPLAPDARQMPLGVANPIDSSFRVGRGRHYKKNLRWHRRQKELRQTVRALRIHPSAKPHGNLLHDGQPYHSLGHHDEVMLDSLEEGQLLENDPYLPDSMLKKLGRFGMEGMSG